MKNFLTIICLLIGFGVSAQDKIYKKTGEVTSSKVMEIGEEFVVYKMYNNLEGPNYKIRKEAVEKIVYQNGTVDSFTNDPNAGRQNYAPAPPVNREPETPAGNGGYGFNVISFDFLSILFNEVGFSYERILNSGFIGIKVPLIIGMNSTANTSVRQYPNVFQSGIDLNLYPAGQGRARYFIGPAFRFGQNENRYYDYYTTDSRNTYSTIAFQVNNGVMFQPAKHFNISLLFGVGLRKMNVISGSGRDRSDNYAVIQANLSYRF
ncbi:MAG: hypothetical protein V4616_08835 [Bacteroidota bacterium]